ncbi:MAG: virulence RhuM family protein [Candidatus Delongbacteria bacterium]|jgi:hypothetical protein|nr:virulence RhuM family protein [Candidatus Delongbacteria bacterium]
MKNEIVKKENTTEFMIYTTSDGKVKVDVMLLDENIWLAQKSIADLFGVNTPAVNKHLKNIYDSGELLKEATVSILEIVQDEGNRKVKRNVEFYNLDAIIAIGYRVNSFQATQFRVWATNTLKEFIIKGFVLDDERLKQTKTAFGKDYFDELLERIREIRSSERRFYQKITDIYSLASDYDSKAAITKEFFSSVQNKLHWAITGKTAAEIIYDSADAEKLYMGLTTWKRAPKGIILKSDVSVAKNYLNKAHIDELNRIVSAYLDLAENRANRGLVTKMQDWVKFLDKFLSLSDYPILADKGKVSALEAKIKAESEYDKFRVVQDRNYVSDFDLEVKRLLGNEKKD